MVWVVYECCCNFCIFLSCWRTSTTTAMITRTGKQELLIKQHKQTMVLTNTPFGYGSNSAIISVPYAINARFQFHFVSVKANINSSISMSVRVFVARKVFHLLDSIIFNGWLWKIVVYYFTRLYKSHNRYVHNTRKKCVSPFILQ